MFAEREDARTLTHAALFPGLLPRCLVAIVLVYLLASLHTAPVCPGDSRLKPLADHENIWLAGHRAQPRMPGYELHRLRMAKHNRWFDVEEQGEEYLDLAEWPAH
jgi:hypothetical protein